MRRMRNCVSAIAGTQNAAPSSTAPIRLRVVCLIAYSIYEPRRKRVPLAAIKIRSDYLLAGGTMPFMRAYTTICP